ncbi:AAA domain-containing protein [Ralstonia sp. 25mfcol4.1]|uniref:TniB family NTP-binding protein n=1 Tax=Ralstonia sp. 25mfcol4.1 TaxID=1761899 RepID=UPI00088195A6|nr:TniB family NTP-binding protein [Ralstonia sp. 25mfcol4.1]SDP81902.1 AAA domain-containing protein [Ralstonia sp. 25mfcol4.1]
MKNDLEQAAHEVSRYIIDYPAFHDLREKMERMLRSPDPRGLLIVGDTRVGKTTLAKSILEAHPRSTVDGTPSAPVMYIEVPTIPTEKSIARGLMLQLDVTTSRSLSEQDLIARFTKVVEYCRIRLVIIDEFHHFTETAQHPKLHRYANSVKSLMNRAGVSVVLMGLPSARAVLDKSQQLRGRFSSVQHIGAFAMEDSTQFNDFLDVLRALAKKLPFENGEELADELFGPRMWYATHGALGYVKKLLIEAIEMSEATKRRLTMPLMEKAFTAAIWHEGVGKMNPFNRGFSHHLLDEEGQPFCPDLTF